MKSPTMLAAAVITGACAAAPGAQDESASEPGVPAIAPAFDMSSVDHARQQDAAGVKAQHEMLEYFAGEWTTVTRMQAPGYEMPDSPGTATARRTMGGRFLEIEASGDFMGQPVEAQILIGYDVFERRYDMAFVNTMGTSIHRAHGLATVGGTSIVFYGNMAEPALGLHDRSVKYIVRPLDEDRWAFEVYDLHINEQGMKVVESIYTRVK